jgi:hypothetical protein
MLQKQAHSQRRYRTTFAARRRKIKGKVEGMLLSEKRKLVKLPDSRPLGNPLPQITDANRHACSNSLAEPKSENNHLQQLQLSNQQFVASFFFQLL